MPAWRLGAVGLAGLAVAVMSVVPGWVVHVRHVGGHGLTTISVTWSAWEGRAWPFLPAAVVVAGAVGLGALAGIARPRLMRGGWLPAGPMVVAGLLAGSTLPLERLGYASRVVVTPGPVLVAAALLALAALAVAAGRSWGPRPMLASVAVVVLLAGLTYGGRVLALDLAEGNPRHYADGSYRREATDGPPPATLTIREGTYRIDDRWSGTMSGRGLVAVLTDDPACPDARGAYRVFSAGGEDIRWNLIVDLCGDGARAADLTTGVWRRQP